MQTAAYYNDTYEDHARTQVIATGTREGEPWIAVEHCLLHPQGGGQPADRGWVDGCEVTPLREHDSGLVIAVAIAGQALPALPVGGPVEVRIDLELRMLHAALHTAGHLIEAAGRSRGWVLAANNHFPDQARIEFTAPQPDAALDTPEGREDVTQTLRDYIADAIAQDVPVTRTNDDDGRRIVHLGGLHAAACGGTHVRSLADLHAVELSAVKVKKGRIKVSYSAIHGERA